MYEPWQGISIVEMQRVEKTIRNADNKVAKWQEKQLFLTRWTSSSARFAMAKERF
jgi:hypothetical protein